MIMSYVFWLRISVIMWVSAAFELVRWIIFCSGRVTVLACWVLGFSKGSPQPVASF